MTLTTTDTVIKEYTSADAGAVARLYQASDPGWPEGFVDNMLLDPETILEDLEGEKILNIYLAWADEKAVGFASLVPHWEEGEYGYLGLLTADPNYHGRGIGRDLIRAVIDRCIELGFKRLDLDTWPGNTRAVPLYKKTGFGWGPEAAQLQNHMPLLLSHPLTKPYFETVDWYACLQRDLKLERDTERRNGALVFTYEWDTDTGSLRAVFDQKTKRLVELETKYLLLSLDADAVELAHGKEMEVRLRVRSKSDRTLLVAVNATGDGPVKASHYGAVQVGPGEEEQLNWKAGASGEDVGDGSIKVSLLINGDALEMSATLKIIRAVEMGLEPSAPHGRPGAPVHATLNLRNRLPEMVEVEIAAAPAEGLTVSPARQSVRLGSGETTGVELEIASPTSGAHTLALSAAVKAGDGVQALPPLTTDVTVVGPGEVVMSREKKDTRLVSERYALLLPAKGTGCTLIDRRTGKTLVTASVWVGPPFWPSPLWEQEFEATVRQSAGAATALLRGALKEPVGVHLERAYRVRADGSTTVVITLTNLGTEERKLRAALQCMPELQRAAYLPLHEGVVRGQGGLPGWPWGGPHAEPPFAARWMAMDVGVGTVGVLWPEGLGARSTAESWMRLMLRGPLTALAPGDSWSSGKIELLPAPGGWEDIERTWQDRQGTARSVSAVLPAAGVRIVPVPVLLLEEGTDIHVEARSYFPRLTDAEVEVKTAESVAVEPVHLSFEGLSSLGPKQQSIRIKPTNLRREAGVLELEATMSHAAGRYTAPIIALGTSGDVSVSESTDQGEQVWCVDNGWLRYGVRPTILAAVYTLQSPDGELLYSNFPQPRPRHWDYPVYGGIKPVLWERNRGYSADDLGRLNGLTFAVEAAERQGSQGITWRGVKLAADLMHESLLGLRLEIEYLTVAQSNVLAVVSTLSSRGAARAVRYNLEVSPASQPELPVLIGPDQALIATSGMRGGANLHGKRWAAVEWPGTGTHLVLVTADGDGVDTYEMSGEGVSLSGPIEVTVRSGATVQTCHYVAVAKDRRQAELYGSLADLRGP